MGIGQECASRNGRSRGPPACLIGALGSLKFRAISRTQPTKPSKPFVGWDDASWRKMPLCSRCKETKRESEFYTYRTRAGRVQVKNPCMDCTKRNTRVSKTRRELLTAKRG
jgi:hypothetical protein